MVDLPGVIILLWRDGSGFLGFFVDIAGGETACEYNFVFTVSSLGESLRLLCSTCGPGWWALTFSR